MNFYVYNEDKELGEESLGTIGKFMHKDLKTIEGVRNRVKKLGWPTYRIYTFTNFYDNSTFKLVHKQVQK